MERFDRPVFIVTTRTRHSVPAVRETEGEVVLQEARVLPALALPAAWPVCLRATGLLPLTLVGEGEDAQAVRLLYWLYSMYLAVLSALQRPWYTGPRRNCGCQAQARSLTPSWPWTLSPTATGRSQPGRAIDMPDKCCR